MFGRGTDLTRCLVIEASGEERDRTVDLLQDLGFDVAGSSSMDEAIDAMKASVPEIILVEQRGSGFAGIGSFQSDLLRFRENPHCGHALRGEDRVPLAEKRIADFYPRRGAIE